jgi:glycosyltransferase involved in cell wall biosynthesis
LNHKDIQILLATCNGERYLREQLDSFLALDNYDRVKVLVRDDGSTDGTLRILAEYEDRCGFEVIRGENIGFAANMFELFRRSDPTCAYFATSDQDDVWLPGKLSAGVRALEKLPQDAPLLYGSATQPTTADLTPIGRPYVPQREISFYNAVIQNFILGHTQILNRRLVELLLRGTAERVTLVDWWVHAVAELTGYVIFDQQSHVLYRQHAGNAIGFKTTAWAYWKNRLKSLMGHDAYLLTRQMRALIEIYGNDSRDEAFLREAQGFLEQRNFHTRMKYILSSRIFRQTAFDTFCFKLLFLFGRYREINGEDHPGRNRVD